MANNRNLGHYSFTFSFWIIFRLLIPVWKRTKVQVPVPVPGNFLCYNLLGTNFIMFSGLLLVCVGCWWAAADWWCWPCLTVQQASQVTTGHSTHSIYQRRLLSSGTTQNRKSQIHLLTYRYCSHCPPKRKWHIKWHSHEKCFEIVTSNYFWGLN
jgi:hypothetical protein